MPLTMPANWIHGARNCRADTSPDLQVHEADRGAWIFRQNKCANSEGPFLYLLAGNTRALLLDTGARPSPGRNLPLRTTVDQLLAQWQSEHNLQPLELIVAHTHSHSDHTFGDRQFMGRPRTRTVEATLPGVRRFFGLNDWPRGSSALDLGSRELTILPCPGREDSHISIYDAVSESLLTGDTVYPGVLVVSDWSAFRTSIAALGDFAAGRVQQVLGAHVEMKRAPREFFAPQTPFQPDEHELPLSAAHLEQLRQAVLSIGSNPHQLILQDFVIEPV